MTTHHSLAKPTVTTTIRRWTATHLAVFLLALSLGLSLFIGGTLYFFVFLDIPDIRSIGSYQPSATTFVYDNQDKIVARIFRQNRIEVGLNTLPPLLPKAFIAAEDARFYEHSGVDGWSILRALLHNLRTGERGQGASTITQQVARAVLLSPEKTYTRKIKEAILAFRIDRALTKDEILHIYLNEIYLGSGAYGVEAAAQVYFDKHATDLNLAEFSLLAGLPQAPSRYSPFRNYKLAKNRQAYVLNRMVEDGFITEDVAQKAYKQPLLWGPTTTYAEENNYFIQHVRNYVEERYGEERLINEGMRIYTTLDQKLQKEAVAAVKRGVAKWAERHKDQVNATTPQAALLAMEAKTGMVRALVGGSDFSRSQYNRAIQARRQPGSAFKPIIYAAALNRGMTPGTVLVDEPLRLQGASAGVRWEPKNFDNKYHGPTTIRDALVYSRNIVTVKTLQEIGVANAIAMARDLGITSPLNTDLSLALGTSELSMLELTAAYSVFAAGGDYHQPIFVTKITDKNGKVLEEATPEAKRVLDPKVAHQMNRILQGVIAEGTAKNIRSLGIPAAGKTSTTDKYMDAWFIGYTTEMVTGVWIGFDQKTPLGKNETGGQAAAPIWLDFMAAAYKAYPVGDFTKPEGEGEDIGQPTAPAEAGDPEIIEETGELTGPAAGNGNHAVTP
ncbi:MAG TPA: penicillin-binding protein 1A [Desulfurivibrionaceae bacterium]|nr:penicillin-binding protein 1A [Desulfurivibrionaceae bacterium]